MRQVDADKLVKDRASNDSVVAERVPIYDDAILYCYIRQFALIKDGENGKKYQNFAEEMILLYGYCACERKPELKKGQENKT